MIKRSKLPFGCILLGLLAANAAANPQTTPGVAARATTSTRATSASAVVEPVSQKVGNTLSLNQFNPEPSKAVVTPMGVSLGFALVAMAAFFSSLGSFLPFVDEIVPRRAFNGKFKDFSIATSKPFLAASLGMSGGLILTLALGDLIPEAVEAFKEAKLLADERYCSLLATVIYLSGYCSIMAFKFIGGFFVRRRNIGCTCDIDQTSCPAAGHSYGNSQAGHEGLEIPKARSEVDIEAGGKLISGENAERMDRLGKQIAGSLAIHNFPEGLSTFAAAVLSPKIGVVYGIALSLHKIPEGLMMSLPLYYSSGSRIKACAIASAAGIMSQFAGALTAFALFSSYWNPAINGFIFSAVSGLLTYTVISGVLPMCFAFDPKDKWVTRYVLVGIIFFFIVISMFEFA